MTYEPGELDYVARTSNNNLMYLSRGQERRCCLRSSVLNYHVEHGSAQSPNQGEYLLPLPCNP